MPDVAPKLSVTEFAAKIKTKYPQYKDISDDELTQKIIAKYPAYAAQVDFKKKVGTTDSPIGGQDLSSGAEPFQNTEPEVTQASGKYGLVTTDAVGSVSSEPKIKPKHISGGGGNWSEPAKPEYKPIVTDATKTSSGEQVTSSPEETEAIQNASSNAIFANAIERGTAQARIADILAGGRQPSQDELVEIARLQRDLRTKSATTSQAYQEFTQAPDASTAMSAFLSDPLTVLGELTLESLTAQARHGITRIGASTAVGAAAGSVVPGIGTAAGAGAGLITGFGLTSYNLEYSNKILEVLQEVGVDLTNADMLRQAFSDPQIIERARTIAQYRGIPVALFDAVSAGIGGKIITKPAKTVLGKIGQYAAEGAVQSGLGMGGELGGQIAANEDLNASSILAEGLAEFASPEILTGAVVEAKKKGQQTADKVNNLYKSAVKNEVTPQQVDDMIDVSVGTGEISIEDANDIKKEYAEQIKENSIPVGTKIGDATVTAQAEDGTYTIQTPTGELEGQTKEYLDAIKNAPTEADVNAFADKISKGEKLKSAEDLQFYDNNKKVIEERLQEKIKEQSKVIDEEVKDLEKQRKEDYYEAEPTHSKLAQAKTPEAKQAIKEKEAAKKDKIDEKIDKKIDKLEQQKEELKTNEQKAQEDTNKDNSLKERQDNADTARDILDEASLSETPLTFAEKDNIHKAINDYEAGVINGEALKKTMLTNGLSEEYVNRAVITKTKPKTTIQNVQEKTQEAKDDVLNTSNVKQKEINQTHRLLDTVRDYNETPRSHSKRREESFSKINQLASALNHQVTLRDGKISITNGATGKALARPREKVQYKKLAERPSHEQDFFTVIHNDLLSETDGDSFAQKLDVGLSQKEINKAVADIKAGKTNGGTEALLDGLSGMLHNESVEFVQGSGNNKHVQSIPIDEYMQEVKGIDAAMERFTAAVDDANASEQATIKSVLDKYSDEEGNLNEKDFVSNFDAITKGLPDGALQELKNIRDEITKGENQNQDAQNPLQAGNEEVVSEAPAEESVAEPPSAEPPTPNPPQGESKEPSGKRKSLANRLVEATNVPQEAKDGIAAAGLTYKPKSQPEAQKIAQAVIAEEGIDQAVLLARANTFAGDVNNAVQAEALTSLTKQGKAATDPKEKSELAKKFAQIAIEYDEWLRDYGRGVAYTNYFYQKSPLGVVMYENAKRKQEFEGWAKEKNQSWKEFFDEMMQEPDFAAVVKAEIREQLKEERAEARANRKKQVDNLIDKAKDQFKDKGAAYSSIIPPPIITGALEVIRKGYHAGEKVAEIIQQAVDYISLKLGHDNWDKEKFRKEWEDKLADKQTPEEIYQARLKKQIAALDEQITNRRKNPPKPKEAKEYSEETKRLIEQRDEKKKILHDTLTKPLNEKILDRFRKKLKGLSESEKDDIIRRSMKLLIENGALKYEEFREIIASVAGYAKLTTEQAAKMEELVEKINHVEKVAEQVREERTEESLIKYKATQLEAGKAQFEFSGLVWNKPDIMKRLTSIMQLNTLGIPSLINNPIYNVWNQAIVRFPVGLINDLIDRALAVAYKAGGKTYEREYNVLGTQKDFFKGLQLGGKEAAEQLVTGLNRMDYFQKEIYGQQIRPKQAVQDLIAYKRGEKKLTKKQVLDKSLQASFGIPAEMVARLLNIGDKPQRFSAERAQGAVFAKTLGLQGIDYKLFLEFPIEEARRAYKASGMTDAEANRKAEYVKAAMTKEGERSTFQQDNLINDLINRAAGKSGTGGFIKAVTVSPFIKIPSNAFWSFYNLVNPEIAILQSMVHGGIAYKFKGKGDNTSALQLREARYWFAHAVTGVALRGVVMALVNAGIFTPANDDDDTKKEREGESFFEPQGTLNITKLRVLLSGGDPDKVQGGLTVSNRWFGQLGTVGNAIARKDEKMTPEQRKAQKEFWDTAFGGMELDALKEAQNGIFANTSSLLSAFNSNPSYGLQRYGLNIMNLMMNTVHPATFAQQSRHQIPYVPTSKGDSFMESIKNDILKRSSVIRTLTGQYPPSKIGIWGDPLTKPDNTALRMFGVSNTNKDNFAQPIYEDYKKTKDIGFFPPAVKGEVSGKKLNFKQTQELEMLIGKARKNYVAPYVNNQAYIDGYEGLYKDLDAAEKKRVLGYLYEQGRQEGIEQFIENHPEFTKAELTDDELEQNLNYKAFQQSVNQ